MYNGILGHFSLCPWPIGHARMKSSAPRNGHASFFSLFASTRVLHYDISLQSRRVCNLFYAVDALAIYFGTVKVSAIILVIVPHQKENPAKLFNQLKLFRCYGSGKMQNYITRHTVVGIAESDEREIASKAEK